MNQLEKLAGELEQKLGLPLNEGRAYLILAAHADLSAPEVMPWIGLDPATTQATLNSLVEKGLVILKSGNPCRYTALHPRMALTNVFKVYQDQVIRQLRERRTAADKLVLQMIPLFERNRVDGGETSR